MVIKMKKWFKIILSVIGIIILLFIIDIACIFIINRPLFAIQNDNVYKGLLYDTYNCAEYSIPQIKIKGTKFSCSNIKISTNKVISITDTTEDMTDFVCVDVLESFYEDDNYTYYFSCSKSKHIIVKYENGYEEEVKEALKNKTITISDLDNYNIKYFKYENNVNNNAVINNSDNDVYINNIPIGLYKYYGSNKDRELITNYNGYWNYHNDISSFEVFYTNEKSINGKRLPITFDEYKNNYENLDSYKIGFKVAFLTTNEEVNKTIISPKDTTSFYGYLEVYLYDDYHREKGVWYSHTTEEEFNDNTLLTSIKLTAGKKINEITSDINVLVFAYNSDNDFDKDGNYIGKIRYSIKVINPNNN